MKTEGKDRIEAAKRLLRMYDMAEPNEQRELYARAIFKMLEKETTDAGR